MAGRLPPPPLCRPSRPQWLLAFSLLTATACRDQTTPSDADSPSEQATETQAASHAPQIIRDRYIVTFTGGVALVEDEARRQVAAHGGRLHFIYRHALHGYAATLPPQAVAALRANPAVRQVEPDQQVWASETQSPVPSWGLDRIDQRALPLSNGYTYTRRGAGSTSTSWTPGSVRVTRTSVGAPWRGRISWAMATGPMTATDTGPTWPADRRNQLRGRQGRDGGRCPGARL